jgi:hypothetical protein
MLVNFAFLGKMGTFVHRCSADEMEIQASRRDYCDLVSISGRTKLMHMHSAHEIMQESLQSLIMATIE